MSPKWSLLLALSVLFGCTKASEDQHLLKLALPTQQISLDPHHYEDLYSMTVVRQIYRGLFAYSPDGRIVPDLVSEWETTPDKKTYKFSLKSATFSDGTAINATHVEASLKRIFSENASLASDMAFIEGAEAFLKGGPLAAIKIKAEGDNTLAITTSAPSSLLLYLLANPDAAVLNIQDPKEKIAFGESSTYSGAFKVAKISKESLSLVKWRTSEFQSKNPPEQIDFHLRNEVKEDLVLSGSYTDTSNFMTLDQKGSQLAESGDWRSVVSEATNERFIVLNPQKIPRDVRRWMLNQVNQEEFVNSLNDSSIVPAYGFIPNFLPGAIKTAPAKLSDANPPSKALSLEITYGENLPYPDLFISYFERVWQHPNLTLRFKALPVSQYLENLFQKKGEVIIAAKGIDYPEGFAAVAYFRSTVDANFLYVKQPKIDELITMASLELNQDARAEIYRDIQLRVLQEATVIPLAFGAWKKHYWHKRVKFVPAHPLGVQFVPLEMLEF